MAMHSTANIDQTFCVFLYPSLSIYVQCMHGNGDVYLCFCFFSDIFMSTSHGNCILNAKYYEKAIELWIWFRVTFRTPFNMFVYRVFYVVFVHLFVCANVRCLSALCILDKTYWKGKTWNEKRESFNLNGRNCDEWNEKLNKRILLLQFDRSHERNSKPHTDITHCLSLIPPNGIWQQKHSNHLKMTQQMHWSSIERIINGLYFHWISSVVINYTPRSSHTTSMRNK